MRTCQAPKHSFLILLIIILSTFIIFPFINQYLISNIIYKIFISAILISSIYICLNKKTTFIITSCLVISILFLTWGIYFYDLMILKIISDVLTIIFFLYVITIFSKVIFLQSQITKDSIFGAICIYFLIGLTWAIIYSSIESIQPNSFIGNLRIDLSQSIFIQKAHKSENFIYYSFVTLTTLGYGDIVPITIPARFLSVIEAVTGQLFIATAIARLVAMFVKSKKKQT